jgi:Holliday junction DNA helicase RuvA
VIASVTGTITAIDGGSIVVDVSGVGYLVQVTNVTANSFRVSESAQFFTSFIVREDGFSLFGFSSVTEQKIFDLLRSVTGVGPKSALAILSSLTVDQIIEAVSQDNDAAFKAVSGIGPKTAKLITLTLNGKLGGASSANTRPDSTQLSVVIAALLGLGVNERAASDAASAAIKILGPQAAANALLKHALATLGAAKSVGASDE